MPTTFTLFLGASDLGMSSTTAPVTCASGQYTQIGSLKTTPQSVNYWGQGLIANGVDSRETAKLDIYSASGRITGNVRFAVQDANGINTIPVLQNNITNLASGVKFGLSSPGAKENSYMVILFNPDTTSTVYFASVTQNVNIPSTRVFQ